MIREVIEVGKTPDPYGYDAGTDTLRVPRHALTRLLLAFREAVEQPGGQWSHMGDWDVSFELLADAVDHANAALGRGPDDRMRCKATAVYRWDELPPGLVVLHVRERLDDGRRRDRGRHCMTVQGQIASALCGFWCATEETSPGGSAPDCGACVRELELRERLGLMPGGGS